MKRTYESVKMKIIDNDDIIRTSGPFEETDGEIDELGL